MTTIPENIVSYPPYLFPKEFDKSQFFIVGKYVGDINSVRGQSREDLTSSDNLNYVVVEYHYVLSKVGSFSVVSASDISRLASNYDIRNASVLNSGGKVKLSVKGVLDKDLPLYVSSENNTLSVISNEGATAFILDAVSENNGITWGYRVFDGVSVILIPAKNLVSLMSHDKVKVLNAKLVSRRGTTPYISAKEDSFSVIGHRLAFQYLPSDLNQTPPAWSQKYYKVLVNQYQKTIKKTQKEVNDTTVSNHSRVSNQEDTNTNGREIKNKGLFSKVRSFLSNK